jgi:class 3 adenylate cyclase
MIPVTAFGEGMSATFRTLVIGASAASRNLLARLIDGSDIVIDDVVGPEQLVASVARRAPDLFVIDAEHDARTLTMVCGLLKANPVTMLLPLLAIAKSAKQRLAAFEAGVDDFLTYTVRREEFLVRAHALLRVSAARRQLAAEQLSQEVQQRELIRAAFRRYISPKLADKILADPQLRDFTFAQTQVRSRAAVMFADMRGFTAISEKLNPSEVVTLLNEFFALLTDITFEYDGTVFNMAGDGLMVGFGVPIEQADGSARAIAAARRMLDNFALIAEQWRERFGVETGLGIGINVGEVIAGNVGSAAYMNYTIIGDTVNVASRLGQRARAGEMLFSDAVKHSLDEHGVSIGALPLPALVLRGRSMPIDIFCVPSVSRLDFRPA